MLCFNCALIPSPFNPDKHSHTHTRTHKHHYHALSSGHTCQDELRLICERCITVADYGDTIIDAYCNELNYLLAPSALMEKNSSLSVWLLYTDALLEWNQRLVEKEVCVCLWAAERTTNKGGVCV